MKVLCLGAGAVGGYFCGRLAEAKAADVTFLVRPARKRQLIEGGLRVESALGDFALPVQAITQDEITGPADIVLLTCKAYDLDGAIASIRPAVGPGTAVLPLLNGISHIDRLNAEFGRDRVLGGLAKIAITLLPDGSIKHLNDWRFIVFGEQDGRLSDRVTMLKAAFDRSPAVVAKAVTDIQHQLWQKLVHLATVAGMTTLFRASVGEIARAPGGIATMLGFLDLNAEIAARSGFPIGADDLSELRRMFSDTTAPYTASMLRDIERKGPVEADHIIGFLLEAARRHGVDETLHRISYLGLKAYEQRRAAGRL